MTLPSAELPKTFDAATAEPRLYQKWEANRHHAARADSATKPFTIMMPPPNVTGSLHMGHALNMTLQDILTRYHRMLGDNVLWLPGTDHAGIATQMVVERQLAESGENRRDLGRAKFLERVWAWKEKSGATITGQLRRLGALPDWSRERFTMDDGLSKAVTHAFVTMYNDGLIYRAKRLVNWDPKLQTAISDIEVQQKEIKGYLYHIRYPIVGEADTFVTIATTRPETMLGDVAIVVHPDDERYKHLIGKQVELPLVGRHLPIIADDYVDPALGTGAMKVTPAHDFNDYALGQKHQLAQIAILDLQGRIVTEDVPATYAGLDRFDARKKIVADLEAQDLLVEAQPHTHNVPHSERGGVPVEPMLTDQWFVDAATLAKPALAAVRNGQTEFVPKNWEKTYFEWLDNIQPWCISRQLWWGHQIPAWHGDDGKIYVAETAAAAQAQAGAGVKLQQDPDVFDTWFSSGLWPFSTLGWPDQTPDLAAYYPGNVLITGFDIIFFWVARMMMMSLYFMQQVPFKTIYIHALVRDESGAKMSKSKGNVIDPLAIIDDYGADALRFTLTAMAGQGRDIKLSPQRVELSRNFATKLWNAARFCQMNGCAYTPSFPPEAAQDTLNKWIIGKLAQTAQAVTTALDDYRFNDAATTLYEFIWHGFCDWYVELAKPILQTDGHAAGAEVRATASYVIRQILHLLHPIMPFVTEELWAELYSETSLLQTQGWPQFNSNLVDAAATAEIDWLITAITAIRSTRTTLNVPAGNLIPLNVVDIDNQTSLRLNQYAPILKRLARLTDITLAKPTGSANAQIPLDGALFILPLEGVIDLTAETARLSKNAGKFQQEIDGIQTRLADDGFRARAPDEIIDEQNEKLAAAQDHYARITAALSQISGG